LATIESIDMKQLLLVKEIQTNENKDKLLLSK